MYSAISPTGFLRLKQVLELVPISKSAWWDGCKTGRFPKPVKLGPRTTAWKAEDIAALVKSLGGQDAGEYGPKSE
ncbi:MAG: AlpA family phage regulatory protein [Desulfovibrio sp.]|nr:AlpA family phage regulatory protein [Desulfovibrio sp.]